MAEGELLRVALDFPDYKLRLRVWEAKVGRLKLYLLDSNDPGNMPIYRGITSELYGGGPELRLATGTGAGNRRMASVKATGAEP